LGNKGLHGTDRLVGDKAGAELTVELFCFSSILSQRKVNAFVG
jgi:hypothetical protein